MTAKAEALATIQRLPDDVSLEEIAEELEILAAVRKGQEDVAAGRVKSHEEVEKLLPSWITK